MNTLTRHPLAKITPDLSKEEMEGLRISIRSHGQLEPGFIYEGKILDGFHRYLICKELGLEFKYQEFTNHTISPTEFIVSKLEGRNLNKSQKACIAVSAREKRMAEIKATRVCRNQITGPSGLPKRNASKDVAPMFGVNWQFIEDAARLKRRNLDLFHAVLNGKLSLKHAIKQIGVIHPDKVHQGSGRPRKEFSVQDPAQAPLPSVFDSWIDIKNFDLIQMSNNWDLVIERFGRGWNAKYVPKQAGKLGYSPSIEHAIIAAAREVLK